MSIGKYLEGVGASGIYANTNPTLRMPQTTPAFGTAGVTRAWTDANGNFVPDCDLLNPSAQDLRASGGDLCGVLSNVSFGSNVLTNAFDASILTGWGVRPSDWNLAAVDPAADRKTVLGGRDLHPPLVPRLHRRRQPVAGAVRPDPVQHRGAAGFPAAGRRRLHRPGAL